MKKEFAIGTLSLSIPKTNKHFYIWRNSSNDRIGAALLQKISSWKLNSYAQFHVYVQEQNLEFQAFVATAEQLFTFEIQIAHSCFPPINLYADHKTNFFYRAPKL